MKLGRKIACIKSNTARDDSLRISKPFSDTVNKEPHRYESVALCLCVIRVLSFSDIISSTDLKRASLLEEAPETGQAKMSYPSSSTLI